MSEILCLSCGVPTEASMPNCSSCGTQQNFRVGFTVGKSKVVAGLLAIFLGGFGAHRFYLGQPKLAFLYIGALFIFGVSALVGFFEGVRYLLMKDAKFVEELRKGSN